MCRLETKWTIRYKTQAVEYRRVRETPSNRPIASHSRHEQQRWRRIALCASCAIKFHATSIHRHTRVPRPPRLRRWSHPRGEDICQPIHWFWHQDPVGSEGKRLFFRLIGGLFLRWLWGVGLTSRDPPYSLRFLLRSIGYSDGEILPSLSSCRSSVISYLLQSTRNSCINRLRQGLRGSGSRSYW